MDRARSKLNRKFKDSGHTFFDVSDNFLHFSKWHGQEIEIFTWFEQTKLREGNVFTPVCDSVHRGVSVQGVLCPGGFLSRSVSVQGGLCPVGLCPGLAGGLCLGREVFCPGGVSVMEIPLV